MNFDKKNIELARIYEKIENLQTRAKELEEQKKQAEDMEYLKIIRTTGISAEELQLLIKQGNAQQKEILKSREKEQTGHEEIT